MSDQNWPPASSDGDGKNPPQGGTPEPGAPYDQPGGYEPPSQPGGFDLPPEQGPYSPPPDQGQYTPPPAYPGQSSYPPAQSFGQQPGTYPPNDPSAYPSVDPYGQQPAYGSQGYAPVGPTSGPTLGGAPLADWPKRALGGLIDWVAPSIVISIVLGIIPNDALRSTLSSVLSLAWFLYVGYKNGTTGVTLGKSIAKLKLVGESTGQPIGLANGIIRQFAHIIDSAICLVGWLFPLWDSKRQTIADKIMRSVVIDNSADPNAGKYTWWP